MRTERPLVALAGLAPAEAETLGVVHTPREILQQPRVWLDTFDRVREKAGQLSPLLRSSGLGSARPPEIILIGAGSSDFVARLVAPAFRSRFGATTRVLASTDLLTQAGALLLPDRQHLFVWFSRSGTTPEALELLEWLEREFNGAHHLFITCNAQGAFAGREPGPRSSSLLLADAVHDRGLAMTSSFTSMALAGLLVALGAPELDGMAQAVSDLALVAERLLDHGAAVALDLASRRNSSACFLGSGPLKAAAGECALKLVELTDGRVKTRSDSFLGIRHGPLASLDQDTALIGFLSRTPAERLYELELVREVRDKALCGVIALISPERDPRAGELADHTIELDVPPRLPEPLRPLLDVIVGQMLALFSSLDHGIRPDAPSANGAIKRVVAQIRPARDGQGDDAR